MQNIALYCIASYCSCFHRAILKWMHCIAFDQIWGISNAAPPRLLPSQCAVPARSRRRIFKTLFCMALHHTGARISLHLSLGTAFSWILRAFPLHLSLFIAFGWILGAFPLHFNLFIAFGGISNASSTDLAACSLAERLTRKSKPLQCALFKSWHYIWFENLGISNQLSPLLLLLLLLGADPQAQAAPVRSSMRRCK